jgi:hypothetical protein
MLRSEAAILMKRTGEKMMSEVTIALGDSVRKAAKDKFKEWSEKNIDDPAGAKFAYKMFDNTVDLVQEALAHGGVPDKKFIASHFISKASSGLASLTEQQRIQCVTSVVNLGVTAIRNPAKAGGPIGWTAYLAFILYDGLPAWGECSLAWQEMQGEEKVKEFERYLESQRALRGKQKLLPAKPLDHELDILLKWDAVNACKM